MNTRQLLLAVLILSISPIGSTNDTAIDEDSLFGGNNTSEDALFGATEDDELVTEEALFSEGLLSEAEEDGVDLAQEFLQGSETYLLNGDITLTATSSRGDHKANGKTTNDQIEAAGTLTFDVRPSATLRGLLKADYSITQDANDTSLREAIVDWTIDEQWYLRAGRQVMHWGVGYFYSPADLINSNTINAKDPEAARAGTDALKVHFPTGNNNYYAYLVPLTGIGNQTVGLKGEWLLDVNEVSLAALSRPNGHNSIAATAYLPSNDFNYFAELVVHHGVQTVALDSNAISTDRSQRWLAQSTLGTSYAYSDHDDYQISVRAQYFDNGLGYASPVWQTHTASWQGLAVSHDIETSLYGRYYTALSLRWASILQSDYSLSLSSLHNLTDASGRTKASLSYNYSDDVKATLSYTKSVGAIAGEYSHHGSGDSVSLKLQLLSREY
ncbi:MAG: hypothetical protein QGG88_08105 [Gammaproteobacteria bacterium]|jgi:hypothetical protein|nr:hypothetical protein [Gammaproteobacteria bacterium]